MPGEPQTDVVTGAFSYSGAAIARDLLAAGHRVRTLTGHPGRAPAGTRIDVQPLDFTDPDALRRSLQGARTLYNTYWIRFRHGGMTHETAVANSRVLFQAAADAGIQRIVHVSITHADSGSPYPYFRGKGEAERHLKAAGVPCAIVRPAILFGGGDVLVNNIAWLLRRLPVFAISRAVIVPAPGWLIPPLSAVLGAMLRDVLLTREEYQAMAAGLADSGAPASGRTSLTDWVTEHGDSLGRGYASELDRHYR